jgi:hypothetical protein
MLTFQALALSSFSGMIVAMSHEADQLYMSQNVCAKAKSKMECVKFIVF